MITVWILTVSLHLTNMGNIGASSLPQTWPTEEECLVEAKNTEHYIRTHRHDFDELEVRCVPMHKHE